MLAVLRRIHELILLSLPSNIRLILLLTKITFLIAARRYLPVRSYCVLVGMVPTVFIRSLVVGPLGFLIRHATFNAVALLFVPVLAEADVPVRHINLRHLELFLFRFSLFFHHAGSRLVRPNLVVDRLLPVRPTCLGDAFANGLLPVDQADHVAPSFFDIAMIVESIGYLIRISLLYLVTPIGIKRQWCIVHAGRWSNWSYRSHNRSTLIDRQRLNLWDITNFTLVLSILYLTLLNMMKPRIIHHLYFLHVILRYPISAYVEHRLIPRIRMLQPVRRWRIVAHIRRRNLIVHSFCIWGLDLAECRQVI